MLFQPIVVSLTQEPPSPAASDLATVWTDPATGTISVVGELDISNVGLVSAAIDPFIAANRDLILDLQGLAFIDCTGLRLFVRVADRLGEHGSRLVLRSPRSIVMRAMELTQVSDHPHLRVEHSHSPDLPHPAA